MKKNPGATLFGAGNTSPLVIQASAQMSSLQKGLPAPRNLQLHPLPHHPDLLAPSLLPRSEIIFLLVYLLVPWLPTKAPGRE